MNKINELVKQVQAADVIVVGGGSGMSNAAGMDFWYEASPIFLKHMQYFYNKYHFAGVFKGYYNHFDSPEERWAFILKFLHLIYTEPPRKPTYQYLQTVVGNKPAHFITTNQDGLFKKFFNPQQVSEIQGSWSFFQSSNTKTDNQLYPARPLVDKLLPKIQDNHLDSKYFPKSKVDGAPLIAWVRGPKFLEGQRYYDEYHKFNHFIGQYRDKKVLFLEMGVGRMTPMFIQEPFWEMTKYLPNAYYININPKDALTNPVIKDKSLLISADINEVLKQAAAKIKGETDND